MLSIEALETAEYRFFCDADGPRYCKWIWGTHPNKQQYKRFQIVVKVAEFADPIGTRFFPEVSFTTEFGSGESMMVNLGTHHGTTIESMETFFENVYLRLNCVPYNN